MSTAEITIDTSIVVCTCSRVHLLRGAVESLLAQSWARDHAVELVVVDDGSSDGTAAFLQELQGRSPFAVRVIAGPRQGIAAARNTGSMAAHGVWLASFDDDQIAAPHWLRALRERAEATGVDAIGGALTLLLPPEAAHRQLGPRVRAVLGEHLPFPTAQRYSGSHHPATNNALLRRTRFLAEGGFDVAFTEGGEDKEFFRRLQAAGQTLWFEPAAGAGHVIPAQRLQRSNLRWTSLRLGAADARLCVRAGTAQTLHVLAMRALVTALRDTPRLLFAGKVLRLETRCSLWYTEGLVRALLSFSRASGRSSRFLQSLNFRERNGEREAA